MTESGLTFGLPLLTKDLIEQAARKRTYILRVVYAIVLYGAALWIYADIAGGGAQAGIANLGRGREMFYQLINVQLMAIMILLPAISCGTITAEKEQDTLGLLLLTKLSPTTIVLEKLISRLVTMGTYQLLSLPLFAVVYGLGGVELFQIISSIWYLAWWSIIVGALSVCCSTWFRTTAGAFMAAYATIPFVACFATSCLNALNPALSELWQWQGDMSWFRFLMSIIGSAFLLMVMSIPMLVVTLVIVGISQVQLVERAFVPPRNLLLEFFKQLDAFFEELNNQTTSGVVLIRESDKGPEFEPIAWRETRKRSLGTVRYLFRLLVVLEVPLALAISWTVTDQVQSFDGPTAFFLSVLWPIAAIAITVHTTNVLSAERSRQTMDVLLVAPLSSDELISQKLAGVRRLIGVLSVPFATLLIFQTVWTLYVVRGLTMFQGGSSEGNVFLHEVLGMGVGLIIYPRIIQWMAFRLSLRMKNQTQTVLFTLAAIIAVCGFPYVVIYLIAIVFEIDPASLQWMAWLSPVHALFYRQSVYDRRSPFSAGPSAQSQDALFIGLILHAVVYAGFWWLLRRRALSEFSGCLGRAEPPRSSAEMVPEPVA